MPKFKFDKYTWLTIAATVVVVFLIVSSSLKQMHSTTSKGDVDIYLNASRLIVEGQDIYATANRGGVDYYVYPPLLAVMLIPIAYLPIELVIFAWTTFNILLVYLSLRLLYEAMSGERFGDLPQRLRWILIWVPILLTAGALQHHLIYGQANLLVYFLVILGLWLMAKGRWWGSLLVGVSIVTKLLTLPFGAWFVVKRDIRAAAGTFLGVIGGLLLPALVIGWSKNLVYLDFWVRNIILDDTRRLRHWNLYINFSLQGQLTRFFTNVPMYEGSSHSLTIVELSPETLKLLGLGVMAAVVIALAAYAWFSRRSRALISQWGGVALTFSLIPVFSPVALKHHFVALLPAYFFVVYLWHRCNLRDRTTIGLVAASFALTSLVSQDLIGKNLSIVLTQSGSLIWGTLLLAAAIFRLPFIHFGDDPNAVPSVEPAINDKEINNVP